ncbi:DUF1330 domain-containing protein [Frankia sp. R82]|uniref:DUF1330 domain-containing protein n=1 Tax=Frankia sp. R82 TaxID=2950553 RepID=UPI0035ABB013
MVEFPNSQAAHDWHASPEYAQALMYRKQGARRRLLFADGIDESAGGARPRQGAAAVLTRPVRTACTSAAWSASF